MADCISQHVLLGAALLTATLASISAGRSAADCSRANDSRKNVGRTKVGQTVAFALGVAPVTPSIIQLLAKTSLSTEILQQLWRSCGAKPSPYCRRGPGRPPQGDTDKRAPPSRPRRSWPGRVAMATASATTPALAQTMIDFRSFDVDTGPRCWNIYLTLIRPRGFNAA